MTDKPTPLDRRRPGPARALPRWAFGLLVAAVRYLFHRVPLYRRNRRHPEECVVPDLGRELPGDPSPVQRAADGLGPLYHRRYEIAFTDADTSPEETIRNLREDPNVASPIEVSSFERLGGGDGLLETGDELVVRLPGPWNGPVRVVDVTPSSMRLATLKGHMEAGEIEFRVGTNDRGWTVFVIESWARSADKLFLLLYRRLPVARELQLHMWSHFCERVARIANGIVMTNVEVHTCTPGDEQPR